MRTSSGFCRPGAHGYLLKDSAGREVLDAILADSAGDTYLSQPVMNTLIGDTFHRRGQAYKTDPLGGGRPKNGPPACFFQKS